jgi:hypothetical protein
MDKPIFIVGCTKSGTTLMRSLFDGHPDLFVIPTESHFFQNIKYWVSYFPRRTKPQNLKFDEMKSELRYWIKHVNSINQEITDGFTENRWNLQEFKKVIDSSPVTNLRDLSDLYVRAMYRSLYQKDYTSSLEFVEKSVENAEFASEWKQLYPQARFIHILRNPYSNLVSLRKYMSHSAKSFPALKTAVYAMYNSYYFLYKNLRNIDDYKVVIYEDLLDNPQKVMKDIALFLDLNLNDILLKPTLFGKLWEGNSMSGEKFQGISKKNIDRWKKDITDFEIHIVNELFEFILADYGFTVLNPKHNRHYPIAHESIINYIKNRLLWKFMPRF